MKPSGSESLKSRGESVPNVGSPYKSGSAISAGFVRVMVALIWLLTAIQYDYSVLAQLPERMYRPVGLIEWLGPVMGGALVSESALVGGQWVLAMVAVWVLLGLPASRFAAVLMAIGALWIQSAVRSYTPYANHAEIVALLIVLVLPFLPVYSGFSMFPEKPKPHRWREAVLIPAVVLIATYVFVGAARMGQVGIEVFMDDTMMGWISLRQAAPSSYPTRWFDWALVANLIRPVAGIGFAFMTLLEIASPAIFWFERFRRFWLVSMLAMHVFAFLVLNVLFWENVLLLFAVVWSVHAVTAPVLPKWRPHIADGEAFQKIDNVDGAVGYVFFDGVCNLCNGLVDSLMKRDKRGSLGFGSLQGESAAAIGIGTEQGGDLNSMMFVTQQGIYKESTAVIMTLTSLGGVYGFARLLLYIPRPIRDVLYRIVAKLRYRVFGKRDTCRLPTAEESRRFVP